jgi:hypothetical protein
MRYGFNPVTYIQRPLVIDRRGGTERNLNVSNGWQPITDAGVAYERAVMECDCVISIKCDLLLT